MTPRPAIAASPLGFGRRARPELEQPCPGAAPRRSAIDELRVFGTTFAAGFLFVTVLIA